MSFCNNVNNLDDNEMFIVSLNRQIPIKHLNLIYCLDNQLDECVITKYDDISNIVHSIYNTKYDSDFIKCIMNLLRSNQSSTNIFSLQNVDEIINEYSKNCHYITLASAYTIKPFALCCMDCRQALKLVFKEKVDVFLSDRVDSSVIFSARCCQIEYHTNSYIKYSKRFVVPKSLYNQRYVWFGGKCVVTIEVLLRYASELFNIVS